ncbi:MAG: hypothetical protein WA324_16010 [Bryobacteraceae bacterium]
MIRHICKVCIAWLISFAIIGGANWWLISRGFQSTDASEAFAKALIVSASSEPLARMIATFPQIPVLAVTLARWIPGASCAVLPYVLGALLASFVPARLYDCLRTRGCTIFSAALIAALFLLNPLFLWTAWSGIQSAVTFLMYAYFTLALLRIAKEQDARGFMMLALALPILFFSSPIAGLLIAALVLLLPAALPKSMVASNPIAGYVVAFVPAALAIISWVYLCWIFHLNWRSVLLPRFEQSISGTTLRTIWELDSTRDLVLAPMVLTLLGAAAAPLLCAALLYRKITAEARRAIFVASLAPILIAFFEIAEDSLKHPAPILALLCACVLAVLLCFARVIVRRPMTTALLLACGVCGGWAICILGPSPELISWQNVLAGQNPEILNASDRSLANWLAGSEEPTLLDVNGAYPLVAALGTASRLLVSGEREYAVELQGARLSIPQFAIPDPASAAGYVNTIDRRYPDAYASGMPGYTLAYDFGGWRVYRLLALPKVPSPSSQTVLNDIGSIGVWIGAAAILAVLAAATALLTLLGQIRPVRSTLGLNTPMVEDASLRGSEATE